MNEVLFKEGSPKLYWKSDHDNKEYERGEFLTRKFRAVVLGNEQKTPKKDGPRGVTKSKIDEITSKIGPMIPKENFGMIFPQMKTQRI